MPAPARRPRLLALGAIGVAVFAAGVVVAAFRLPEWRNRRVPDQEVFAARLQEAARVADLRIEGVPRFELRSKSTLNDTSDLIGHRETAYGSLGPGAADWLAREGRGPYVLAVVRGRRTRRERGELTVLFSLRGLPVSATWVTDDMLRGSSPAPAAERSTRRAALERILLPDGARPTETSVSVFGDTAYVSPVPGSAPAESLIAMSYGATTASFAQRVAGTDAWWRRRLEGLTLESLLTASLAPFIARGILILGTFAVFIMLLGQRRIELRKGAVLAAVSMALSLAEPIRDSSTWIQLLQALVLVAGKGLSLFILWSAAESWLRSTIPNFRTSLDALRAGRLGPIGGRAMLAGWSIGAAIAGVWLAALSVAILIQGVAPSDGSIGLPHFSARTSPIDEGAIRTAIVVLAICAGLRLPVIRRIPGSATVLAAIVLATRVPLASYWACLVVALLVATILVRGYATFGLTALLAAAMTSTVLPAALFSLIHFSWLTSSGLLLAAVAVAPLAFGAIGVRRSGALEEGPFAPPAFVRRLEEENRLKYEMELLAKMQLGLLPSVMPRVEGYEIAARSILATEAGGDLYDFVPDSMGRLWIAAGDVSGHGYSCAIAQAMTKAGLASLVEAERTPAMVLERLDNVLRGIDAPRTFTTLALIRLDPQSGELLVSNAGHPYPWIACNGDAREVELPSLPLGQGPTRRYTDAPITIESGVVLVLCSDGLVEGTDANGAAPYGFDRVQQVLAKVSRRPAEAILAALLEDWRTHVGPTAPADDTTIVVVKRR
jgi:stage II sporulation SpoE-like protein